MFLACAYLGFAVPFLMATAARSAPAWVALGVAGVLTGLLALRLLPVARSGRV